MLIIGFFAVRLDCKKMSACGPKHFYNLHFDQHVPSSCEGLVPEDIFCNSFRKQRQALIHIKFKQ